MKAGLDVTVWKPDLGITDATDTGFSTFSMKDLSIACDLFETLILRESRSNASQTRQAIAYELMTCTCRLETTEDSNRAASLDLL
jgi:hypothetical protein